MVIKGSNDAALQADGSGKRFTLSTDAASGNNVTLELSDEVWIGNQWVKMPTGYPSVTLQGSKQLFAFRIPKFTGTALYDPIVAGLGSPASADDDDDNTGLIVGVVVGISVGVLLIGLLVFLKTKQKKQGSLTSDTHDLYKEGGNV